jgi:tRNA-uridine 2-sulfurtransferase
MAAKTRVVVAMSGGVDSSVAAALLLEQGYECVGATLQLFPNGRCGAADAIAGAQKVAEQLGIEHFVLDGRNRFETTVLRPAWDEYACGRTPNPCVSCNEKIKFGVLQDFAASIGAQHLATGHYVRLVRPEDGGPMQLWRGVYRPKDQSYFLFALTAAQREFCVMPLGDQTKAAVRAKARQLGLDSAENPESQDACFATDTESFPEVLRKYFKAESPGGAIVDESGNPLGRHLGIHQYTIGQRQGLGVSLGQRAWVKRIDPATGEIELTTSGEALMATGLDVSDVRWLSEPEARPCQVQIRYRHAATPARVEPLGSDRARIVFEQPQRAVAPGQAAVWYDGDRVLGGGWIDRAL